MLHHNRCISFVLFAIIIVVFQMAEAEGHPISANSNNSSPFPIHGVVEGFYGRHWTPEERLDIIRFMGEFGLQSYFYAPKDDPFHRSRWREPYTGRHLEIFEELLDEARRHQVTVYYAISPGLDMVYSSEDDYQALLAKLKAMVGLGIRHVALFLDDVPETLNHAADREMFANLGEAHVHVINRLHADLREAGAELVVCPTTYTNAWGSREYLRILGKGLPAEIPLFWTGTDVAIAQITAEEAREWGKKMQRKPLIWDNFPVNDYDRWRVFLGPLEGRDAELAHTTTGIVANPMNQPYASMISLATVAMYVLDPFNYDPETALEQALRDLYPADVLPHIRELVALYREPGWEDNVFTPIYTPGKPFHVETITKALDRFEEALDGLISMGYKPEEMPGTESQTGSSRKPDMDTPETRRVRGLVAELRPFLESTRADFLAMVENPSFITESDGYLHFNLERQVIQARRAPFEISQDGDLREWAYEAFHAIPVAGKPMEPDAMSSTRAGSHPQVAALHDDTHLHLGIRIFRNGDLMRRDPFFSGDHILLLVDSDPADTDTWIRPQDPVVVMRPDPDKPTQRDPQFEVRVFELTPFTQRGISDIHLYTLTSFFYHPFTHPAYPDVIKFAEEVSFGWMPTEYGYSAVVSIPHYGRPEIRATLAGLFTTETDAGRQSHRFLLSKRPYLGNTCTFPVIRLTGL